MRSISEQLRKNFIFIAALSIAFVTIISNISINIFFSNYIKESRTRDDLKVVSYVETVYEDYHDLTPDAIMSIIHYAFSESVTVVLKNTSGKTMWSSNSGEMMSGMEGIEVEDSTLEFRNYPLEHGGKTIGSIDVGRSRSIINSLEDREFLNAINFVFAVAFMFSMIIAIISSLRVSRRFLQPIYRIRENINLIELGRYKDLRTVDTNTWELHQMSLSIKELSERLNQQEVLRRRMTSDMAHELRTPLATLQSHIEAFIDGVWQPDLEKLSIVYEEVIHLTRLIKELSDLSIIENDEIKINKSEIDLSTLINTIADSFEPLVGSKNITLKKSIEENVFVEGDRDHFNRIFINILSNGYKYTNEGGEIFVELRSLEKYISVVIKDTGIGIPKEDINLVFERFYRSDMSRSRGTGGTGIGLTITKTLVEANGGTIRLKSEQGMGTEVICQFEKTKKKK